MNKIRKGDSVKILTGKDIGKTGIVHSVFPKRERIIVSGINLIKKAQRRTPNITTQAGIIEREGPIDVSNVAIVCKNCGMRLPAKAKFCRKCGGLLRLSG